MTAPQTTVVRTDRGLSVAGTRITLYSIMDYVKADWPPRLIRDLFDLTDRQIADITDYIENHREEIETEYRAVLREAEEIRQYWEERILPGSHPCPPDAVMKKPGPSCRRRRQSWE